MWVGFHFLVSGMFSAMIENASRIYCQVNETFPSDVVALTKNEIEIEQNFPISFEMLKHKNFITGIQFGTYQRINDVMVHITLQQNDISMNQRISATMLKDNEYYPLKWNTSELKAGNALIKIHCTGVGENNFIGIYTTQDLVFDEKMLVNQKEEKKNLKMKVMYILR